MIWEARQRRGESKRTGGEEEDGVEDGLRAGSLSLPEKSRSAQSVALDSLSTPSVCGWQGPEPLGKGEAPSSPILGVCWATSAPLKPYNIYSPSSRGSEGELAHELLTASLSSWPRLLG